MIRDIFASITSVYRRNGLKSVLEHLVWPLFEFRTAYLYQKSLLEPIFIIKANTPIITNIMNFNDLYKLREIFPPMRLRRFEAKMKAGELCMAGFSGNHAIAIIWAAFKGTPSSNELPFSIQTNETYYWGAYCLPEYREKGVTTEVGLALNSYLHSQGFRRKYQLVEKDNQAAIQLFNKLNNQRIGELVTIRFNNKRWFHYEPHLREGQI